MSDLSNMPKEFCPEDESTPSLSRTERVERIKRQTREADERLEQSQCGIKASPASPPRADMSFIERELRMRLWMGHGHSGLYGDDGEMQCGQCVPLWDYRRTPIEQLVEHVNRLALLRIAEAQKALPTPPAQTEDR